jgi:hypothetical protein
MRLRRRARARARRKRDDASEPSSRDHLLQEPVLVDLAEERALLEHIRLRPPGGDAPGSSTTISSARAIVDRRWAMMIVVRSRITSRRPARMRASVVASTEAVASSRTRMRGSIRSALAIAMRWRWPPESVIPRSHDRVVPLRELEDEVVRLGGSGCGLDRVVRRVGHSEGDVVPDRRGEEERVLRDHPDLAPKRSPLEVADVDAVDEHPPGGRLVEAGDERGERGLSRSGAADERDRPPGEISSWTSSSTGRPGSYPKSTRSNTTEPGPGGSGRACSASAISQALSRISKMRSPAAVAR